jgi:hypothetical protein
LPILLRHGLRVQKLRLLLQMRGFDVSDDSSSLRFGGALKLGTPAELRLYCLYKVPDDGRDFKLTVDDFHRFKTSFIEGQLKGYLGRAASLFGPEAVVIPKDWPLLASVRDLVARGQIRSTLLLAEDLVRNELARLRRQPEPTPEGRLAYALVRGIVESCAPGLIAITGRA